MHSTDRLLTTHVGSLVRPPKLSAILERRRDGEQVDEAEYERVLRESVIDVVRHQADAGIDIVSDGEFGKAITWANYVYPRLSGLEHRSDVGWDPELVQHSQDVIVSRVLLRLHGPPGHRDGRGARLVLRGRAALHRPGRAAARHRELEGRAGAGRRRRRVPARRGAGERLRRGLVGEPYTTEEEFVFAVAEALRAEYETILDAGLLLQVDDAFLPWTYDLMVPPATMEDYRAWAQLRIDALNHALRGLPPDRIRYHICWGSFNVPHVGGVPARDIIDLVLQVNAGSYLIEMANPRHEHQWRVWEDVRLPDGKVLVISHCTNVVEHPELVAERLTRLARLVGRENVLGGTDCGFAQGRSCAAGTSRSSGRSCARPARAPRWRRASCGVRRWRRSGATPAGWP